jgi:hypothetical protein
MFTVRLLRESTAVAAQHALRLVHTLNKKLLATKSPSSSSSVVVDMQDMYFRLTMDIFT